VLLVVGATSAFSELKDSLDEIWGVPPPKDAGWWDTVRTRLLSFGLILTLGLLLMTSLVVRPRSRGREICRRHVAGCHRHTRLGGIGFRLPGDRRDVRRHLQAAAADQAVLARRQHRRARHGDHVHAGEIRIGLYIGNSGTTSSFGAAGSLIALLLWVYYSAQIFFLGRRIRAAVCAAAGQPAQEGCAGGEAGRGQGCRCRSGGALRSCLQHAAFPRRRERMLSFAVLQ
jgi:membrane protein